jgi:hypothetical protein
MRMTGSHFRQYLHDTMVSPATAWLTVPLSLCSLSPQPEG